jgi:hypothetical protein
MLERKALGNCEPKNTNLLLKFVDIHESAQ